MAKAGLEISSSCRLQEKTGEPLAGPRGQADRSYGQ